VITLEEVEAAIVRIKGKANDPEVAHGLEDKLYLDVIVAISLGAKNPKKLAEAALKCSEIKFPRWCA
jgi:hypothetical protein